jgi:hypothetical protein
VTTPRTIPPRQAGERATLTAFLDWQRATLALKCEELTDDQLRERAVPPSGLSLLGIVRHMAEVERNWFRPVLSRTAAAHRCSGSGPRAARPPSTGSTAPVIKLACSDSR